VDLLAVGFGNQHRGGLLCWSMLSRGRDIGATKKCLISNWNFLWAETLREFRRRGVGWLTAWAVARITC
jgi:hypothetical protein